MSILLSALFLRKVLFLCKERCPQRSAKLRSANPLRAVLSAKKRRYYRCSSKSLTR